MGQLYYRNLHREFFERYPTETTNFYAVSGFVGPEPLSKLKQLHFNSTVIYGLQRETPDPLLHRELTKIHCDKVCILYPETPSHSKCYLWVAGDRPLRGLVGSANFSTNGLNNDFRETLMEVERPDLHAIWAYFKLIETNSTKCIDVTSRPSPTPPRYGKRGESCEMKLYDPRTGQVQDNAGLNWGFANAHVVPNDAYIPIRVSDIREFPSLFQPVVFNPEAGHRSRHEFEAVELIWDDGTLMEALFEGSQPIDDIRYPKQISSIPSKSILGEYLRRRLGLPPVTDRRDPSEKITRVHLERYGRNSVTLSLIQPGIYSVDFSPE